VLSKEGGNRGDSTCAINERQRAMDLRGICQIKWDSGELKIEAQIGLLGQNAKKNCIRNATYMELGEDSTVEKRGLVFVKY
jgi:hypothetical protein